MERSEIRQHFPTLFRPRRLFAIRLPSLSRRTWLILALILAVVLGDGILALRRREYLERARRYREMSVLAAADEQTQLKALKFAESGNAGFERAIAEFEQHRDAEPGGPERRMWDARLEESRSFLAYNRNVVVNVQREYAARTTARRVYFQRLLNKYLDAASHPWRSVPPDPPPPE